VPHPQTPDRARRRNLRRAFGMDALAFIRFAGQTRTGERAVSETDFGEED